MKTTRKTIRRESDQTYSYKIGEILLMKWNRAWTIMASRYDSEKDETIIRLEKQ